MNSMKKKPEYMISLGPLITQIKEKMIPSSEEIDTYWIRTFRKKIRTSEEKKCMLGQWYL